jgi:hypothetical protein
LHERSIHPIPDPRGSRRGADGVLINRFDGNRQLAGERGAGGGGRSALLRDANRSFLIK